MRYVLRRLGFFVLTLWVALTVNFLLPRLMPGNPALAMMSKFHGELSPKALNALEVLFGVNTHESLIGQYFSYLHQILTGNFGISLDEYPASVTSVIGSAIWWTVGLVGVTTVLAFILGNGLCNMVTPTSGMLLAFIAASKVGFGEWIRFIAPLFAAMLVIAVVALGIAVAIGY